MYYWRVGIFFSVRKNASFSMASFHERSLEMRVSGILAFFFVLMVFCECVFQCEFFFNGSYSVHVAESTCGRRVVERRPRAIFWR